MLPPHSESRSRRNWGKICFMREEQIEHGADQHKVFSSFLIQSCIAFIAFVALLGFYLCSRGTNSTEKGKTESHSSRLIVALVEFHKAQCYFSSVIQITAMVLFFKSRKSNTDNVNSSSYDTAGTFQDYFDTSVLTVLASSGLIPIALILACITRFGRQSWYLLVLSWAAVILATATLAASYYWAHKTAKAQGIYDNNLGYGWNTIDVYGAANSCNLNGTLGDTVLPLCGTSSLLENALPAEIIANWWTWLAWANCIVWVLACTGKKWYDSGRRPPFHERIRATFNARLKGNSGFDATKIRGLWAVVFFVPWSLCFASQFYLFSAFFDHSVISYTWSFGQIIAIFVWLPCIIEYLYIEISKWILWLFTLSFLSCIG